MNRKNFVKRACSIGIGSCIGMGLSRELLASGGSPATGTTAVVPVNARQIQNVLTFVESTIDEPTRKSVFERLGYEHTTDTGFQNWINGYKGNVKGFIEMVNSNKDTYWERMEYDARKSEIKIIGRPVDKCACPYAQCPNPPKSLCNYCCKSFQINMFTMMLERPVKAQIDESFLLGGSRCSTTIFFEGKLDF